MSKIKTYIKLLKAYFYTRISNRADFILSFIFDLLNACIPIMVIRIIYIHIPNLKGWSYEYLILIYGFAIISKGLYSVFCSNLENIGSYIADGKLEVFLVRPAPVILSIMADDIKIDRLSGVFLGAVIVCPTLLKIKWSIYNFPILLSPIIGTWIYCVIIIFVSSISFWHISRFSLSDTVLEISDYAKYPTSIFNKGIQFIITLILPYTMTAYIPVKLILLNSRDSIIYYSGCIILVSILYYIATKIWRKGLSIYEGTGS